MKREDQGTVRIVCTRRSPRKCYVCGAAATVLCDYPSDGDGQEATCSRPCCKAHARYWTRGLDVCADHAKELGCW